MDGLLKNERDTYSDIIAQEREQQESSAPVSQLNEEAMRYQQIIREEIDQQDQVLRQSLMVSVGKDPNQVAQIQQLAEQTGLPVEAVQTNVARLLQDKRVEELRETAKLSPILAKQLSDPNFAAIAYDDVKRLSALETLIAKPFDYSRESMDAVIGKTFGAGMKGVGELYGVSTRAIEGVLEQILPNSAMSLLRTEIPWFISPESLLKNAGRDLKTIGAVIAPPPERRTFDVEVVGAISQLGAQIAMTLVNPALSTATLVGQGADAMAEAVEGDDATQAQKDTAIVAGAGITAITERIGIDAILDRLPPKIRNRTMRFIANAAMGGGIEAAQEVAEGLMHDLARRFLTNEDAPILEGALQEGSVAAVAGAIVRAALTKRSYQRASQQEQFFRDLGEAARDSSLRERMPQEFAAYVDTLTKGSPVKEVFVPVEQFQRYYQSQNVDPEAKAAELGVPNYTEAVAAGTDIVIPMGQFTTKVAPTDDLQGLYQDIRIEQGGLTPREFAEYQADQDARMQEILDDARRSVGEIQTPELQTIKDEMRQQLVATGYETSTAEAYATVYAKTMSNLAERAGLDVKTLHDKYNLSVTRPLPDVLTRDRRSDAQIDPLLDRLRKGDLPGQREIYGKSLVDFLIEQGGLKAYGELTDADVGRGPFQRNLIQETGMDADTAAQLAVEYGYLQGRGFEDITERDLFDAIDEDLRGAPQYSVMQADPQLQELMTQLDNLAQALEQLGINLDQITDNAEVRRLLEQATQAPELRDAIEPLFQAAQPAPRQPGDNLLAIHNLTEENVRFTAKMGGLASPSVGVVTDTKGMVEGGFGDITLIGTKNLADPSVDPVFSADAYTVRYPDPEWNKPKRADADALYEIARQAEQIIDTGITERTDAFTTRNPNGGNLVSEWLNSDAIRALYLQQQGIAFDIIRDPVRSEINLTEEQLQLLRPLYDAVYQQQNQGIRESAELDQLRSELANMMRLFYEQKGIRPQTIDSIVERYTTNPMMTLGNEYTRQQRGPQINRGETGQSIQNKINPVYENFRKWVEDTVLSRFDDPHLTVGRKKVPYTLDNIIKVVTSKKEQRAVEKTLGYGDAKAKAAATLQFSDIEQMRKAAKEMIVQPEEFAAARQESQDIMLEYRERMVKYDHRYPDQEVRRDDSMRAIAKFSTSKTKTPEAMRKALAAHDFLNVDQISDDDIEFAMQAADQLIRLPVPYFEAKPQRIVRLDEFAGAVVPLDTSQDVIDILESNGMRVEFHEGFDRQEAVQRLANQLAVDRQNILFQDQISSQPLPENQTVKFEKFVTGQPVTFDFAHNTQSATQMFGMPEPGDRFQRDLEPSGRYMTQVADAAKVDTSGTMIAGTITFNNPLVIDSINWKQTLSDFYGATGSQLSQRLIAAGYDGVVTINPATETRPAFTSEILDLTTFDADLALYQQERGFIQFGKDRKFNITLLERADLSTFLHETGHFYLEVLGDLSQGPEASPQLQDDYQAVLNFLGLKSRDELTLDGKDLSSAAYKKAVAAHEKFARANEAYLMEGKAPSPELRSIFQRFRVWLKAIYKDFMRLDVTLTNEVRGVFDRIYATDQEIEAAQAEGSFDPLFLDAAAAGMTEAEFQAYKESVRQAGESAKESLQVKMMREMQRETKAWWKEELANVKDEVGKEFDELPAFKAFKELTEGEIKLNKQELLDTYGAEYLKRLPRGFQRVYTRKEGMPLEVAAREFGYPSGDALIEGLIGLPNRKEYIDAEAERRMIERHGDILTDGTAADEAKIALHNDNRAKVLAAELKALRRKAREIRPFVQAERETARAARAEMREAMVTPPLSAFREAARGMIGQTAVRDIQPQRFLNAQRKLGKQAERAIIAGDAAAAADAKQKELLNHYLYLEARNAREKSDAIAKYVSKFEKKSTRERIGKAGQIYLEQIDAILDGYEFRRIPNRKIDRRATLNAFVERMKTKAEGDDNLSEEPVNIPASVLEDARQINYRQLSYDELQGVNEAVKNIENLASLKNRLLKVAEKRDLDEAAREAIETLEANSKGGRAKKLESALPAERPGRFLRGFMLLHTKFSTMMRQMDGWKDGGTLWNLFVRPLNDAADYEAVKRAEATKKLRDIFKVYRDTNIFAKTHIKTLGQSMTLQGRLMVALNWGRAENRQRLIDGNGFTQAQIDEILGSLDERDWGAVKNIWELLQSYWPDISEQYTRLYGVAPQESDALAFSTKYGMMPGGYFPIKYDPTKTAQAQAQSADEILQQMKSGAYMRSQTKNGFTKEVLEKLDRPIKLDLSSLYEHLGEVVHDLALREYLLDTNKLMNHRVDGTTLKQSIIDNYGDQFYAEIRDTLRDVAIGDIGARNAFEQSMSHLRAGVSIAGMGWNLMTGLMQPLGLSQSFVRVGPKWISKGLMKWGMDAVGLQNSAKWIYEQSDFMRTRSLTQNREINEIRNQIKRQGRFPMAREAWGVLEDSYFQLIIQGQKLVDIPTWLGAYEKAVSEGSDNARAVALADQAVIDSQGGGSVKDLAAIQRGSPLLKLWTNFYSYFNTTFNLTKEVIGRTQFNDPVSVGRAAIDVVMLYSVPVILGVALREAAKLIVGADDEDDEDMVARLQREHLTYLLGTMVGLREFSTAFDPRFGYSGPAGVRFIADFNRFVTQVSQGELDDALRKATVATFGTLLHYPAGQINRIIDGIQALQDGRAESPAALIFGVPR